jgi:hypothetical protein
MHKITGYPFALFYLMVASDTSKVPAGNPAGTEIMIDIRFYKDSGLQVILALTS